MGIIKEQKLWMRKAEKYEHEEKNITKCHYCTDLCSIKKEAFGRTDNIATEGLQAFDTLEDVVNRLGKLGKHRLIKFFPGRPVSSHFVSVIF